MLNATNICHNISLCFDGHFPGGPGLANTRMSPFWILLELRMMEVVVTTGAMSQHILGDNFQHNNQPLKL